MTAPPAVERNHALDALRGAALLLGVLLHACMSYMPGSEYFWLTSDQTESVIASGTFFWIHSFRMLVFFLFAGYFGKQLLDRYGARTFMRDRARRVLTPLLAGWPIVFSAIVGVIVWNAWLVHGGQLPQQAPPGPKFTPDSFPLTHLWFLYVLLLFYVAALVCRWAQRAVFIQKALARVTTIFCRGLSHPTGRWLMLVPMATGLLLLPKWMPWFGIPTPDNSLYPNVAALLAYGSAFAYGWLRAGQANGLAGHRSSWKSALAIAIVASVALISWMGPTPSFEHAVPGLSGRPIAFAALYALNGWAWVFALLGLAQAYAARPGKWTRYLADASFWIYFIHLPIVAAGQVLLSRIDAPGYLEFPMLLTASGVLLLGSYQVLIRNTSVGRALGFASKRQGAPQMTIKPPTSAKLPA